MNAVLFSRRCQHGSRGAAKRSPTDIAGNARGDTVEPLPRRRCAASPPHAFHSGSGQLQNTGKIAARERKKWQ
jgi:hypothetical protein